MTGPRIKYTYEDYQRLPEGERYQLLNGMLVREPAPGTPHQTVSGNLFYLFQQFVRTTGAGVVFSAPVDLILSRENVLQPDLAFIARERAAAIVHVNGIWSTPDLVVEILSPSTENRDRDIKRDIYARFGLPELWLVDVRNQVVEVYRLQESELTPAGRFQPGDAVTTPVMPGLSVPVDEVFRPAPGLSTLSPDPVG